MAAGLGQRWLTEATALAAAGAHQQQRPGQRCSTEARPWAGAGCGGGRGLTPAFSLRSFSSSS